MCLGINYVLYAGVKIRRTLGPMVRKIACGPSKVISGGPAEPADFETSVIPLLVPLAKKDNLSSQKIARALKNITLRVQITLGNFYLF